MIATLGLVVLLAGGLVPLIQRDLRRAVERQEYRRRFAAFRPRWVMGMTLGMAEAVKAAAEMERTFARVAAASAMSQDDVARIGQRLREAGWNPPGGN